MSIDKAKQFLENNYTSLEGLYWNSDDDHLDADYIAQIMNDFLEEERKKFKNTNSEEYKKGYSDGYAYGTDNGFD